MQAGPKKAVDPSALPWRPRSTGSARFAAFCRKFIRVPKGTGALSPLILRDWQIGLVGSVLRVFWSDADQAYVGICREFESLSRLAPAATMYEALTGIKRLVAEVVAARVARLSTRSSGPKP